MLSLLNSNNYSLLALPLAWIIGFLPHASKIVIWSSYGYKYNNVQPRQNTLKANQNLPPHKQLQIQRLEALHQNAHETFPLFATSLILANIANLHVVTRNHFAIFFIATRIIFSLAYAFQQSPRSAALRTFAWFAGIAANFYILIKSANAFVYV
ncbi:hypothetical protein E3Q08_03568 [Wallemia mellicola]|uniref:MAPEG family protein n=1 Tax=Wallemia mellicola TaxID=1708541 RepID=A0AB38MNF4_9BASI|nr:hypothetical protein E3Q24_03433 [Wallemia mellicola]TIB88759.1 hypothetical protein E3Q21_00788 [Wallemia mellicola]TIB91357.1 hypothetical protein E3Q20_00774 [Wallemia mellicola]TIC07164.1 hypothetical protein E3Q16_00636 [Wallemia mellicola]TIC36748.1 hypothetical protein E3Q09_01064 [Wallemia mellicola]